MKVAFIVAAVLVAVGSMFAALWFVDDYIAPLFLFSRIERLNERNLPKIMVEKGSTIYCRMKADDFRFPLPRGSRAVNPVVTGGFDTVDGSVEARFNGTNRVTAGEYESSLAVKIPVGGEVRAEMIPGGLLIKFHYWGDR